MLTVDSALQDCVFFLVIRKTLFQNHIKYVELVLFFAVLPGRHSGE